MGNQFLAGQIVVLRAEDAWSIAGGTLALVLLVAFATTVGWAEIKLMGRLDRDIGRPPLREALRQSAPSRRELRREHGLGFWPCLAVFVAVSLLGYSVILLAQRG